MLCVPPPRAGAEQPGAAPALSIALEQLPASPSQVQREHGKTFQEIKAFWLGKELVQLEKKILLASKENTRSFLSLKDK